MSSRRWLALLVLPVVGGCAQSQDGAPDAQPARDVERAEPNFEAEEMPAAAPPRGLDELERELANNEAKLRDLGVLVANRDAGAAETVVDQAPAGGSDRRETGTVVRSKDKGGKKAKQEPKSPSKADNKSGAGSLADDLDDTVGGAPRPDPAKSVQGTPTDKPNEQAEDRCPLICSLADSTCDLSDEICELAERHATDDAYGQACERGTSDCEQAKEACLECLG